jgi:hypothetical protein
MTKGFDQGLCPKCNSDDVSKMVDRYAYNEYFFDADTKKWSEDPDFCEMGDETDKGSYNCNSCGHSEEITA